MVPVTALCLFQLPKRASGFGPFGAFLMPISPFWAQKGLNGPESGIVGQGITISDWWEAFRGHFGPIWEPFQSDFRAQSKRMGPVWSLFFTHLATQNYLNCPKSGIFDHTGLVEAFRGHLGPFVAIWGLFWSDLRPRARGWGLFGGHFSPIWLLKMT